MKFGRKPKLTPERIEHVRKLIEEGESRQYVAEMLGVGRVTLYRHSQAKICTPSSCPNQKKIGWIDGRVAEAFIRACGAKGKQ